MEEVIKRLDRLEKYLVLTEKMKGDGPYYPHLHEELVEIYRAISNDVFMRGM